MGEGLTVQNASVTGRPTVHNLIEILTQPDNIAIVVMMVSTVVCTLVAFREIRINDRLIKDGKKEKVYERMIGD